MSLLIRCTGLRRENEVMVTWLNRVRNNGIMRTNLQFRGSRKVPDESAAFIREGVKMKFR